MWSIYLDNRPSSKMSRTQWNHHGDGFWFNRFLFFFFVFFFLLLHFLSLSFSLSVFSVHLCFICLTQRSPSRYCMCPPGHALFPEQATPSVNSTLQWTDATLLHQHGRFLSKPTSSEWANECVWLRCKRIHIRLQRSQTHSHCFNRDTSRE